MEMKGTAQQFEERERGRFHGACYGLVCLLQKRHTNAACTPDMWPYFLAQCAPLQFHKRMVFMIQSAVESEGA